MKRIQLMVLAAVFAAASLQAQTAVNGSHQVTNASDVARTDIPVVLPCPKGVTYALVTCGDEEIPCQLDDLDQDGSYDELCFLVDLPARHHGRIVSLMIPSAAQRPILPVSILTCSCAIAK